MLSGLLKEGERTNKRCCKRTDFFFIFIFLRSSLVSSQLIRTDWESRIGKPSVRASSIEIRMMLRTFEELTRFLSSMKPRCLSTRFRKLAYSATAFKQ